LKVKSYKLKIESSKRESMKMR